MSNSSIVFYKKIFSLEIWFFKIYRNSACNKKQDIKIEYELEYFSI